MELSGIDRMTEDQADDPRLDSLFWSLCLTRRMLCSATCDSRVEPIFQWSAQATQQMSSRPGMLVQTSLGLHPIGSKTRCFAVFGANKLLFSFRLCQNRVVWSEWHMQQETQTNDMNSQLHLDAVVPLMQSNSRRLHKCSHWIYTSDTHPMRGLGPPSWLCLPLWSQSLVLITICMSVVTRVKQNLTLRSLHMHELQTFPVLCLQDYGSRRNTTGKTRTCRSSAPTRTAKWKVGTNTQGSLSGVHWCISAADRYLSSGLVFAHMKVLWRSTLSDSKLIPFAEAMKIEVQYLSPLRWQVTQPNKSLS